MYGSTSQQRSLILNNWYSPELERQPPSSLFMHISWFCNFNIREAVLNFELFRTLEKSKYFEFNNTIYKKKKKIANSYSNEFKPLRKLTIIVISAWSFRFDGTSQVTWQKVSVFKLYLTIIFLYLLLSLSLLMIYRYWNIQENKFRFRLSFIICHILLNF